MCIRLTSILKSWVEMFRERNELNLALCRGLILNSLAKLRIIF